MFNELEFYRTIYLLDLAFWDYVASQQRLGRVYLKDFV